MKQRKVCIHATGLLAGGFALMLTLTSLSSCTFTRQSAEVAAPPPPIPTAGILGTPIVATLHVPPTPTSLPTPLPMADPTPPLDPATALDGPAVEAAMARMINQIRSDNGLLPLARNPALDDTARTHSCDLAAIGLISHVSPDGRRLSERMPAAIVNWEWPSENLAVGYADVETVVGFWFNEYPPDDWHRRNILATDQREFGVGYCYNADDPAGFRHYWTVDFTRRTDHYPLVLADGAAATTSREIPFALHGDGWAEAMRLGSTPHLSAVPWQPFAARGNYILRPLLGPQTVYAELRGPNGATQVVSATIVLQ